jgi:hypothetical protein
MSEKELLMREFTHAYAAIPDGHNQDGVDLESLGQPSEPKASGSWGFFAACTALSCLGLMLLLFLSISTGAVTDSVAMAGAPPPPPPPASPYKNIVHPDPPTSLWGNVERPYPTGAWWTNLVVDKGEGLIGVYPYALKTMDTGVQISYGASRRLVSKVSILDPFVADLQLGAVEVSYVYADMALCYPMLIC